MIDQSTICAIATSPGIGAIATIRISGENAISIANKVYSSPSKNKHLSNQAPNTVHFGSIVKNGAVIDDVVVSIFKAPRSFTGEDVVEVSCHGAVYIQQKIVQLLVENGARLAKPGEFTQRAFLNGKMDLSQAEAIADLINSSSAASHKVAINQMRGGFSTEISNLREELLTFTTLIELELDFSEEDVEFADRTQLKVLVDKIESIIKKLKDSFRLGNAIKNGVPVAIVGETNVGKSTLLNTLLNEEKAIVSDIHGTTRDVIEDVVNIEGTTFRFFDTAGIRETQDAIETLGIERTFGKVDQASIVLIIVDLHNDIDLILQRIQLIRNKIKEQQLIIVGNKADLVEKQVVTRLIDKITLADNEDIVFISAKQKQNIEQLRSLLLETVNLQKVDENDVIVTNIRHFEALTHAYDAIERVKMGLDSGISSDFLSQDIRECLHYLGEITGEITTDEVLGNIFKNFCIGK